MAQMCFMKTPFKTVMAYLATSPKWSNVAVLSLNSFTVVSALLSSYLCCSVSKQTSWKLVLKMIHTARLINTCTFRVLVLESFWSDFYPVAEVGQLIAVNWSARPSHSSELVHSTAVAVPESISLYPFHTVHSTTRVPWCSWHAENIRLYSLFFFI